MPKEALEYDAKVPAFLQRLKAGYATQDGRHNVQIPRPGRGKSDRLKMDDEGEDEPVVVDERGREVSREDFGKMGGGGDGPADEGEDSGSGRASTGNLERKVRSDNAVGIGGGGGKKRRAGLGKVVGGGEDESADEDDHDRTPVKAITESTQDLKDAVASGKEQAKKQEPKKVKRKKIKLSFDEPD